MNARVSVCDISGMALRMGIVYKITSPSNKIYVGQTTKTLNERVKGHLKQSSNCTLLKHAIQKYTWDAMKLEILVECPNDFLDYYERVFIDVYNSKCPSGYNLDDGGNSNKKRCDETRKAISAGIKKAQAEGRYKNPLYEMTSEERSAFSKRCHDNMSDETKQRRRTALLGRKNPHSFETLQRRKMNARGCVSLQKPSGKFLAFVPASWSPTGRIKYIGTYETKDDALTALETYKQSHVLPPA